MIPKLIIQTGPTALPLVLQAGIVNVRLLNPDFEYRFYDDEMIDAFLAEYFPENRKDYYTFPFRIQRYDFFRYLAIYQFGGFYLDTDVFLVQSLAPLLSTQCVFPFEELTIVGYFWKHFAMDWQVGNYAFGSEPGHPFLAAVIENCLRAKRMPAWRAPMMEGIPRLFRHDFDVLNTTGPGLLSRTLAENPQVGERVSILFPEDVCNRGCWHQFGEYGAHSMNGSWRMSSNIPVRVLKRWWYERRLRIIVAQGRARGRTRSFGRPRKQDLATIT